MPERMDTVPMKKRVTPKPTVPTKRVPRPIIALAAPSTMQPQITIKRELKGGEIGWNLTVPASTIERSLERAVATARRLVIECIGIETLERNLRAAHQSDLTEKLEASLVRKRLEQNEKEAGQ